MDGVCIGGVGDDVVSEVEVDGVCDGVDYSCDF